MLFSRPARKAHRARVAELVDALDSGSSGGNPVKVRVLSRAPSLYARGYGIESRPFDSPHYPMNEGGDKLVTNAADKWFRILPKDGQMENTLVWDWRNKRSILNGKIIEK